MKFATLFLISCVIGVILAWPQVNLEPQTNCYEDGCLQIEAPVSIFPGIYEINPTRWSQQYPNDIMSNTLVVNRLISDATENFGILKKDEIDYHTLAHPGSNVSLKIWLGIQGCPTQNISRKVEVGIFASETFPVLAESAKNVPASEFGLASVPAGYRLVGSMLVDSRHRATNRFVMEDGINFYAPETFVQGCAIVAPSFLPPGVPAPALCDLSSAINLNANGLPLPADTYVIVVQEALGKSRTPYLLFTGEVPTISYKFGGVTDETLVRNFYGQLDVGRTIYANRQHKAYCELE